MNKAFKTPAEILIRKIIVWKIFLYNIKRIIFWASKAILSETSKVLQESGVVDMHLRFSGTKSKELQGRGTFKCWQLNSS